MYVHWVMHTCKCIMVNAGGKRNTRKVCKKQVNLSKTGGKLVKVGGNNNFPEIGVEMYSNRENRGKFEIKKKSSEISADENEEIFREKVTFWSEFENFSKI